MATKTPDPVVAAWRRELETRIAADNAACAAYDSYLKSVIDAAEEKWKASGGCVECSGTGRVLTWSTLDGEGYDEHGPCPVCRGLTPYGMNPRVYGPMRSRGSSTKWPDQAFNDVATPEEKQVAYELADKKNLTQQRVASLTREPVRGDVVVVIKGRKVQPGLYGQVVKVTGGAYGPRVGIFLPVGTIVWTALDNVRVAANLHHDEVADLKVARTHANAEFQKKRDAELAHGRELAASMPALTGSERQVRWATQLRVKALAQGLDPEVARTRTSAKAWIDSR